MSFVQSFLRFACDVAQLESDRYWSFQMKLPLHPTEGKIDLLARLLAYCHAGGGGIVLSKGPFEPEVPVLYQQNDDHSISWWGSVGVPTPRDVQKAIRSHSIRERHIYLYDIGHHQEMRHCLHLTREHWQKRLSFWEFDTPRLEELALLTQSSNMWSCTFSGSVLLITSKMWNIEVALTALDDLVFDESTSESEEA